MNNNLMVSKDKDIIGRSLWVSFPSLKLKKVPAKVDTGADSSSIWCSRIELVDGRLQCVFFGPKSQFYTGQTVVFKKSEFDVTRVANSFGRKEIRYKVKLPVRIKKRRIKATFTLSNRSQKLFPVLIGRSTIRGKFLVDSSKGGPLREEEKQRKTILLEQMKQHKKEIGL